LVLVLECPLTSTAHVYNEEVLPLIHFAHQRFVQSPIEMAINSAHSIAFHRGLGSSTASASQTPYTKYLDAETIEHFSKTAYAKSNFAVVANGADHGEFSKWVGQFFDDVPATPLQQLSQGTEPSKYHGGEERLAHDGGNAMVIAFPGSSSFTGQFYKPEIAVLGSLLGGQSAVKWSPGFTILGQAKATSTTQVKTTSAIYSDAGLLYTSITGSAHAVAETAKAAVEAIKKIAAGEISSEQISKAKAAAKFKELENGQDIRAGLQLSGNGLVNNSKAYQIDEVAKAIDGVSEEAVKSVSTSQIIHLIHRKLTYQLRLPRHYSRTRLPSLRSVTSSFCRTLRSLVLRCKYSHVEERVRCKISFGSGLL
jgi:ubiquinol-cytochrome c reductase core subunit 2